ncbi:MAG: recombinase family protein [Flavobacteriaceae bacterium]|nr:recombinase family protein [Flavobacteriaceae bacterium]
MKRVAIYVRVSTEDQSTELQKSDLLSYIKFRDWNLVKIYEDTGTGTNGDRLEYKRLMKDARSGKFDIVLTWKLDRLFRSLKGVVEALNEFTELGIQFNSYKDQIDMTTASGRLMTHMLAAFGEFEAALIRERVMAGLENAKKKGVKLGRPSVIDVEELLRLKAEGLSIRVMAKELNCSKSTVHKTLKRIEEEGPLTN